MVANLQFFGNVLIIVVWLLGLRVRRDYLKNGSLTQAIARKLRIVSGLLVYNVVVLNDFMLHFYHPNRPTVAGPCRAHLHAQASLGRSVK